MEEEQVQETAPTTQVKLQVRLCSWNDGSVIEIALLMIIFTSEILYYRRKFINDE